MKRLSDEDVKYCTSQKECWDCYAEDKAEPAVRWQVRGRFSVPCCKKHFYAHETRIIEANAKQHARTSAEKRKAGICTYRNCDNELIPKELLPSWWKQEGTCGLHGMFKPFRVTRMGLAQFVLEHVLTPEERKGMTPANMIYRPRQDFILLGLAGPGLYHTKGFPAKGLLNLYGQFRWRRSSPHKAEIPPLQTFEP
jgi:hypothetical protein